MEANHTLVHILGKGGGTVDRSMDFHTNKEHYRSRSHSKSKGSCSVLTSPHNASGRKGETSLTTEHHKYRS